MSKLIEPRIYRIVHLTSAHPVADVRIFHKECRSLARAGFEVIQICNHDYNATVDGVQIIGLGKTAGRISRFTNGMIKTCRAALRFQGDLYHVHDPDLLVVGLTLRAFGKLVIYDIHEDLPTKVLLKMYLPKIIRRPLSYITGYVENIAASLMNGLITATPALRDRFEMANQNIVVVNNFPMLEEFNNSGAPEWKNREPNVAYFGGISEARGIDGMIQAVCMLSSELNVKLELAGWFYVKSLLDHLQTKPSWKIVNWHGDVNRQCLQALLKKVSVGLVLLHPEKSFITSQPTKLYEYMAAGIPVIASDFPLWRTIVKTFDCGLLVDPLDTRAIARAIEQLITRPDDAQAMGRRGRQAIERHFNWENEEQILMNFYSKLLARLPVGTGCRVKNYSNV